MQNEREKIMARIYSDYTLLEKMGHTVLGVFLQGSQNYNLQYEGSDIDTKAIVLPKFEDFVMTSKQTSTTHMLPSTEHVDIKDIRIMFNTIKKQNINFVEILFTDYYYINPDFEDLFQVILDNRESIARFNEFGAVKCMIGMALEKHKALEHVYPSTKEKIEKYKMDPKQLHHILRMHDFLYNYVDGKPYKECLVPDDIEYLIDIKRCIEDGEIIPLERARQMAKDYVADIRELGNAYIETLEKPYENEEVSNLITKAITDIMREHFRLELTKGA